MAWKSSDFVERARRVRLVVLDNDGVMTDGRVYYDDTGRQMLAFDIQDGHGIRMALRAEDFEVAVITARENRILEKRAEEIGITDVIQGAKHKLPAFEALVARKKLSRGAVAYMGDDVLDLPVLRRVGLPMAPGDAVREVKQVCSLVTSAGGGRGAVREALEEILKVQGKWAGLMARYLE